MLEKIKRRGETLFSDSKTGKVFTELKGGFSWPRGKDAFISLIGEERKSAKLWIVFERYENSMHDLAKRILTLQRNYSIDRWNWIADIEGRNGSFDQMLYDKTFTTDGGGIVPSQPSIAQDFHSALQILRSEFQKNHLILPKDGILANIYEELSQNSIIKPDFLEKYPEVMVVANIVSGFPRYEERLEKYIPKHAWPEFFEDDDGPRHWMAW